jgi:hypothetical protein
MTPDDTQTVLASNALNSLFNISADDWAEISKRVGLVEVTRNLESEVAQYLPSFPSLVTASDTWTATTFPGLVTQAQALAAYSHTAQVTFGDLKSALDDANLDPAAPLPAVLAAKAQGALLAVTASTKQLAFEFTVLSGQLTNFTRVNQTADSDINAFVQRFGDAWGSLLGETRALETAVEQVLGAWSALSTDLGAAVPAGVDLTMGLLAGLGIDEALLIWQSLERNASAFPALAADQQVYLSGQWLASGAPA